MKYLILTLRFPIRCVNRVSRGFFSYDLWDIYQKLRSIILIDVFFGEKYIGDGKIYFFLDYQYVQIDSNEIIIRKYF